MAFDLNKLLIDVFDPQPSETVTVVVDHPHGKLVDSEQWQERRAMAGEWRDAFVALGRQRGFDVTPLVSYPATGANNANFPEFADCEGNRVPLKATLLEATLVVAMTQYSATAPLSKLSEEKKDFRAASMPGVLKRMEKSALAADYARVAERCKKIFDLMEGAELCDVTFSTGHRAWFDLRFRRAEMDDGALPRFKDGDRIINLPSGETFIVPYEGERSEPSWTAGIIPVKEREELVLFHVSANRIERVEGSGSVARTYRDHFAKDSARTNIAEVAFGVNDRAVVTGVVLEDEKAGFHWAFGRSDHLGGVFGIDAFASEANVIHQDIVYARDNPIQVLRASLRYPDDRWVDVIRDGEYLV